MVWRTFRNKKTKIKQEFQQVQMLNKCTNRLVNFSALFYSLLWFFITILAKKFLSVFRSCPVFGILLVFFLSLQLAITYEFCLILFFHLFQFDVTAAHKKLLNHILFPLLRCIRNTFLYSTIHIVFLSFSLPEIGRLIVKQKRERNTYENSYGT